MSDGAGGVGGSDGGSGGSSGADSAGASAAADSLGSAAESVSESVAEAVGSALGAMADAVGLGEALGSVADALGLDAQDLQGLVGAALMGAITGGLPGAVAAVANAVIGGTVASAAHDAVDSMPAPMQSLAHQAVDALLGSVPGGFASASPQGVLGSLASGALTNGVGPSIGDLGEVARSMTGLADAARDVFGGVAAGNYADAVEAASAFEGVLGVQLAQGRGIAAQVSDAFGAGHGLHADGGLGAVGDAMEQLAVSAARLMASR